MNLLLICEIQQELSLPPLGEALRAHIEEKTHPLARASSCTAWNLLYHGMKTLYPDGFPNGAPRVEFAVGGKPRFSNCTLHFSLAHSGALAAALLSPQPCAVDLEQIRPEIAARLAPRCLSDAEAAAGIDFFEAWTKKECLAKLDGDGLSAHPARMDVLRPEWTGRFFCQNLRWEAEDYMLTALCMNMQPPKIQRLLPKAL